MEKLYPVSCLLCCGISEVEIPSPPFCTHHLWWMGELAPPGSWALESCPYPSPAKALGKASHAPNVDSIVELALVAGVQVSWHWGIWSCKVSAMRRHGQGELCLPHLCPLPPTAARRAVRSLTYCSILECGPFTFLDSRVEVALVVGLPVNPENMRTRQQENQQND